MSANTTDAGVGNVNRAARVFRRLVFTVHMLSHCDSNAYVSRDRGSGSQPDDAAARPWSLPLPLPLPLTHYAMRSRAAYIRHNSNSCPTPSHRMSRATAVVVPDACGLFRSAISVMIVSVWAGLVCVM